ncbi:uncharacterized protein LOC112559837 [Pomacea canaliculata]|uniref:uncharacterized protein LOC112559837 n=1 Tax=Pomacea canaliculata TaxID=400727 RepID=UPI000D731F4C|nr:uncharacterized protein LOC112559837 [Pomacea canaliculata]
MAGNKNQMVQMLLWMTIAFCCMTVGSACRCAIRRDENYCRNDIVFQGRLVARHLEDAHITGNWTFVFEVDRIFWTNNNFAGRRLVLTTPNSTALCGVNFEVNLLYLVAANQRDGQLYTISCLGNVAWKYLDKNWKMFFSNRLQKLCASDEPLK